LHVLECCGNCGVLEDIDYFGIEVSYQKCLISIKSLSCRGVFYFVLISILHCCKHLTNAV
jgi:hypothetical protein